MKIDWTIWAMAAVLAGGAGLVYLGAINQVPGDDTAYAADYHDGGIFDVDGADVEVSATQGSDSGSAVFDAVATVEARIGNGRIVTVPTDAADGHVDIQWTLKRSKGLNAGAVEDLEIVCRLEGGELVIEERWHGGRHKSKPQVDLTLTMPRTLALTAHLGNGDVIAEADSPVEVYVGNGSVKLAGHPTSSSVQIGNGEFKGSCALTEGRHELSIGNGQARLTLAEGSSVTVDAVTAVGHASGESFTTKRNKYAPGESLEGTLGDGTAKLDISIGNGSISVDG